MSQAWIRPLGAASLLGDIMERESIRPASLKTARWLNKSKNVKEGFHLAAELDATLQLMQRLPQLLLLLLIMLLVLLPGDNLKQDNPKDTQRAP